MSGPADKDRASLRVRVTTRLAWLDITQVDFATAIGMDKSSLSRVMRADSPRQRTIERIALGLGLDVSALDESSDPSSLVRGHPAIDPEMPRERRADAVRSWYSNQEGSLNDVHQVHRSDDERQARRAEVRSAVLSGSFSADFARLVAEKYSVSVSQVYADRTQIQDEEV